jgi:hypothetical protein
VAGVGGTKGLRDKTKVELKKRKKRKLGDGDGDGSALMRAFLSMTLTLLEGVTVSILYPP